MKELFLCAALALPALPQSSDKIYDELVRMFERDFPGKSICLVNKVMVIVPLADTVLIKTCQHFGVDQYKQHGDGIRLPLECF